MGYTDSVQSFKTKNTYISRTENNSANTSTEKLSTISNNKKLKMNQIRSISRVESLNPHLMSKNIYNHYNQPVQNREKLLNSHSFTPSRENSP